MQALPLNRRVSERVLRGVPVPSVSGTARSFGAWPLTVAGAAILGALLLGAPPASAQRDPSGLFDFLDADGDGVLTRIEVRRTGLQARFHTIDQDGSGTISRAEFVRGAGERG